MASTLFIDEYFSSDIKAFAAFCIKPYRNVAKLITRRGDEKSLTIFIDNQFCFNPGVTDYTQRTLHEDPLEKGQLDNTEQEQKVRILTHKELDNTEQEQNVRIYLY